VSPPEGRRRVAAGAAALAVLVAAIDAYVVVTILVPIVHDLGIPIDRLERATPIVTGYLLGYVAAMPLLGRLSDRLGRRPVIQGCLVAFAAGSTVSALARALPILVAGRVIQGAAGGALLPVTFALAGDLWAAERRAVPLGVLGAAQEVGSVLGPLSGAGIAALLGWRGVFWANLPLAAAAIVAVRWAVPPAARERERVPLALPSAALLAAALGAIVVGLSNDDPSVATLPPWGPWMLAAGGAAFAAFLVRERRRASLLDRADLRGRPFGAALGTSFLAGAALMVTLVDVPILAQTLLGRSTLGAALVLTRFLVPLPVGAVLGGLLSSRAGERPVALAGFLAAAAGYVLVAVSLPRLDVDLAVAGLGLGILVAPLAGVALRSTSPAQHGVASAGVVVSRMAGMLIGLAALAAWGLHRFAVLTAHLVAPLPFGIPAAEFARRLARYERAVQSALRAEYREVFLVTAAICLAGAALSTLIGATAPARTAAPSLDPSRSGS
jgi:MFS family permease